MPQEITITQWIDALRVGDESAATELWDCYFRRLMAFAKSRMSTIPTATYDSEDVAISTFRVLCEKIRAGEYPDLADRNEFWRLMMVVAIRKINRRIGYESAVKRNAFSANHNRIDEALVIDKEVQQVAMEYQSLLAKLADPNLERVALLKLDGFTNEEIASKIKRTRRTVQRMLELIRDLWSEELNDPT